MDMMVHFEALKSICQVFAHCCSVVRSCCNMWGSSMPCGGDEGCHRSRKIAGEFCRNIIHQREITFNVSRTKRAISRTWINEFDLCGGCWFLLGLKCRDSSVEDVGSVMGTSWHEADDIVSCYVLCCCCHGLGFMGCHGLGFMGCWWMIGWFVWLACLFSVYI